ncbi:fatty acid-binding protein, brain-like [Physella acuta]|uniref:fatty acid-binding protein, brain-like n=1 Tax=Physella acuta TaxID=109671 RepID=UPI0027DE3B1B|nr:fatty acid-binding protein, brain-like [Physella acuta]XP_059178250.1 fatty acid-binding protein, brain-like [Physella acuta]XP_059178251.1 fatty acid-binding protein, brain-like [Physella acuta]
MVEKLFGHWKLQQNENFNEYMKANNVNVALRAVGKSITSYEEIKRDGDHWTIHITSTFKNQKIEFQLGQPFTEHTLDGRDMTSTFSIEGDKLVCIQEPINKSDIPSRFEREVLDDGRMLLTCISIPKNVVAKRYFVAHTP